MIAAYRTNKGNACAKCSKYIDGSSLTPTARRSKQVTGADETVSIVWDALHEACLE